MYNPFYDIVKADELSPDLAAKLFIEEASPIWSDIQYPVNHLVVGPRGAGKTIALRQLDHKSTLSRARVPYVGIYIQVSRLSTIFQNLFTADESSSHFQRVFADYLWLEIIKEIASFVRSSESLLGRVDSHVVAGITNRVIEADSATALEDRCSEVQKDIEEAIHLWSIDNHRTWVPMVDLPASLRRTVVALRRLCPHLNQEHPSLYLLFDESSPVPVECQRVINGLLHRGRAYCVKLAVRPYEWSTLKTEANRTIELNTDIKPLHMQYSNELEGGYISSMRAVANRILTTRVTRADSTRDGWPLDKPLDIQSILSDDSKAYSGFAAVCATSSGNPQNLLSICSCILATAIDMLDTRSDSDDILTRIPARIQHDAIVRWSKDYEDQNPYPESRAFCRSLLKLVREQDAHGKSIGYRYSHDEADLFSSDYLPGDVGELIASAFSGGFIRNTYGDRTSLFDVPSEFHLNRGLLPREGLSLRLPTLPPREIGRVFIRENARERVYRRARVEREGRDGQINAFLSTSFAPRLRQQRRDIKHVLEKEQIRCVDVEDVPGDQFLFTSIRKAIDSNDVTILDATILRPYTMLEIGLCAGARVPKNVICIVNNEGSESSLEGLPKYIKCLHVLTFSFESNSLSRLAGAVRSKCDELLGKPSEFKKVEITNTPLRARRRTNSVFVSLPLRPLRERALSCIRARLKELGWALIVEDDMKSYGANDLQVAIQCAYTSRVGIIDTTGEHGPDLLQCYKVGLFAGKRAPWRVLQIEEERHAKPDTFASVPGVSHGAWNTVDELLAQAEMFVGNAAK